jgi:hypothetical protein
MYKLSVFKMYRINFYKYLDNWQCVGSVMMNLDLAFDCMPGILPQSNLVAQVVSLF